MHSYIFNICLHASMSLNTFTVFNYPQYLSLSFHLQNPLSVALMFLVLLYTEEEREGIEGTQAQILLN